MTRKDLLELKRRMKKEECTFTRMTGCYISGNKEKVVTFSESFLNLPDDEFFKYLEIAKKTLSGTLNNNQLQLFFPYEETGAGSKQQFFMGLDKSGLKDDGLLDRFYDMVIENYDYTGNYLILLFHDAMDVITKTTDRMKLDESSEVYEYILCAICPVTLTKPGLGYIEEENKIGMRLRDWVVSMPENGFVFPAFSDRSADISSMSYYTKNAKDPKPAFMENCLGVKPRKTATQQKKSFENVVKKAVMGTEHEDETQEIFIQLQESICDRVESMEKDGHGDEPLEMDKSVFAKIMADSKIDEYLTPRLARAFEEEFADGLPSADDVLDTKALAKNESKKITKELMGKVENLQDTLSKVKQAAKDTNLMDPETGELLLDDIETMQDTFSDETQQNGIRAGRKELDDHALTCDIFLRVKPDRAGGVCKRMIDGKSYIVIPYTDEDDIDINGLKELI